jgi:hypothetical protein
MLAFSAPATAATKAPAARPTGAITSTILLTITKFPSQGPAAIR